MAKNLRKKNTDEKLCPNQKLRFTYVQATEKDLSLKRVHPALFSLFVGHFYPPGDPMESGSNPDPEKDPDPQH